MIRLNISGAVNQTAFKLGMWAYRRPATRRAYNAAADAIGRKMRSLLGKDCKKYYWEGSTRSDILHAISKEKDLKTTVLERISQHDLECFRETGYIKPNIWRMIAEGPDFNLKTAILSRMSLRDCYQRFYDWNKTNGAKMAIPYRRLWAFELMHAFGADSGSYEGTYKGIIYSDVLLRVQLLISALSRLPHRHKATERDLKDVRTAIKDFELNLILGSRSLDEWYDEFYREPTKYCGGNYLSPMDSIADQLMSQAEGSIGEATDTVGILTRMIPKVVVQKLAHISENEATERLFKPLNEYLHFLQWLPAPERASSEEMGSAFRWALPTNRGWLFGRPETSDIGITMVEYANVGLEIIQKETGKIPV